MKTMFCICVLAAMLNLNGYAQVGAAAVDPLDGFVAGPYLLDVTVDSAVVAFHIEEALPATVRIYDGVAWSEFDSPIAATSHFVSITGLEPEFTYDYEILCGDGAVRTPPGDRGFQIRTACRPEKSFTFAVYGDPRPGDNQTTRYHQEIVNRIMMEEPLFCLVLGDMVDDGSRQDLWREFFQVESGLLRRTAIYPVLGDNDYMDGRGLYADFFPALEKGYYQFEWGGVQFFGLRALGTRERSEAYGVDSPQFKWLENELSRDEVQAAPFRVVFLHDPVYISRGRSSDVLRRVWAPLFEKYKVDVVFASWHMYERSVNEGVTYIISGGAGAELIWMDKDRNYPSQAEARRHHFCKIDVSSNMMTINAITADRTVLDTITLTPRSHEPDSAERLERAARRLSREIVISPDDTFPEIPVYLFSTNCAYCQSLLRYDLPRWAEENKVSLRIMYFDLGREGTYDMFLSAGMDFGRQDADVPALFIGRSVIGGESEIKQKFPNELMAFSQNPELYRQQIITPFSRLHDTKAIRESTFNALTFGIVIFAGLLDGINPCAFTTVILLISYLSLVGGGRKQMLYTGGVFTLAVFVSYLAIGLVFFHFVKVFMGGHVFSTVINITLLVVVAVFAVLSFVDYLKCLKGNVGSITLQLPDSLKGKIREKIRHFAQNPKAVLGASFGLGVVVSGMEMACTGQVYFPIITMIAEPRYRAAATVYLFSYNIAFIIPLVAVFLLAAFGVSSQRMGDIFRRRMAGVKLALALLFVAMGIVLVINLGWFR